MAAGKEGRERKVAGWVSFGIFRYIQLTRLTLGRLAAVKFHDNERGLFVAMFTIRNAAYERERG